MSNNEYMLKVISLALAKQSSSSDIEKNKRLSNIQANFYADEKGNINMSVAEKDNERYDQESYSIDETPRAPSLTNDRVKVKNIDVRCQMVNPLLPDDFPDNLKGSSEFIIHIDEDGKQTYEYPYMEFGDSNTEKLGLITRLFDFISDYAATIIGILGTAFICSLILVFIYMIVSVS